MGLERFAAAFPLSLSRLPSYPCAHSCFYVCLGLQPVASRQASHRTLTSLRPSSLAYLPEVEEGVSGVGEEGSGEAEDVGALETHRAAMARLKAAEDRLRQSKAVREQEAAKKAEALRAMLPHDRLKLQREERARARYAPILCALFNSMLLFAVCSCIWK